MQVKQFIFPAICGLLCLLIAVSVISIHINAQEQEQKNADCDYIQWVSFDVPEQAMEKALEADISSHNETVQLHWVDLLSYLAASYWGDWKKYREKDMDELIEKLKSGQSVEELAAPYQQFNYFREAYEAVLGGMVGEYEIGTGGYDVSGNAVMETKYGLRAYSPIAYGYSFSHYDDFGNSRSYGFSRRHLGNDLMASVGTPVIAVESGVVTHCGWNQYGGWRIGIRSLDGKRYYYYAHLQKDHPFVDGIEEGTIVNAGDPIGYVGMTGYSTEENVNGMKAPHLHFGMQLIFDESQVECDSEIWIDVYDLVNLLEHHKSPVVREEGAADYTRKYPFCDPTVIDAERTISHEVALE